MIDQETIECITKKLQMVMRIQDWDISVKLVSGFEMNNLNDHVDCNTSGVANRNVKLNTANIYINKDKITDEDWYITLVHELLHVQSTTLWYTANAYFEQEHDYFETIYEAFTERQAKMFCSIYPVSNFIKEGE